MESGSYRPPFATPKDLRLICFWLKEELLLLGLYESEKTGAGGEYVDLEGAGKAYVDLEGAGKEYVDLEGAGTEYVDLEDAGTEYADP
tara:strand:- start:209 stop:472 length:264 start_codon:yes stop_codon:yes gene_type:complete